MGKSPNAVNAPAIAVTVADNEPTSSTPSRPASTHSQPPPPYIHPRHNRVAARVTNRADVVQQKQQSRRHGIILRILCLVCDVFAVALFSACLVKQYAIYTDGYSGFINSIGLGGTSYALITAFILFATDLLLIYQHKPAMHPAIPLTFDLLAWSGVLSITLILALHLLDDHSNCGDLSGASSTYIEECEVRNFLFGAERAALVFSFCGVIFHFSLFVRACKHVHKQRKEIREMKATLRAFVEMT